MRQTEKSGENECEGKWCAGRERQVEELKVITDCAVKASVCCLFYASQAGACYFLHHVSAASVFNCALNEGIKMKEAVKGGDTAHYLHFSL